MKFENIVSQIWAYGPTDFGRDSRSTVNLRGIRFFCDINNARFHRFPSKKLRHLNTTSLGVVMKSFRTQALVFYRTRVYQMQPRNGQNWHSSVGKYVHHNRKTAKIRFAHL